METQNKEQGKAALHLTINDTEYEKGPRQQE